MNKLENLNRQLVEMVELTNKSAILVSRLGQVMDDMSKVILDLSKTWASLAETSMVEEFVDIPQDGLIAVKIAFIRRMATSHIPWFEDAYRAWINSGMLSKDQVEKINRTYEQLK